VVVKTSAVILLAYADELVGVLKGSPGPEASLGGAGDSATLTDLAASADCPLQAQAV